MRTHDPNWAPDPNHFKPKRRKMADDAHEIEESVRTISALLQPGEEVSREPLEARVASISAEIAAALAQAHAREYHDDDEYEDEEDDEIFGSGQEMGGSETIGPNTSGIRDLDHDRPRRIESPRTIQAGLLLGDDDDDSDAFPIPLRTRKGKDSIPMIGNKRKR
ncbi:hypothetical protein ONZ45_g13478 [Pleurotus djamor]|nr:hypothetical protein ONZ45_g13478 [Pleurotus djamor]